MHVSLHILLINFFHSLEGNELYGTKSSLLRRTPSRSLYHRACQQKPKLSIKLQYHTHLGSNPEFALKDSHTDRTKGKQRCDMFARSK